MEDIKIQIAIITAITTILTVIITQIINLYINKKTRKKETNESKLKYLNNKLEKLEKLKYELVFHKMDSEVDKNKITENWAHNLMDKLNHYTDSFKLIEHYYNKSIIEKIEDDVNYIVNNLNEIALSPQESIDNKTANYFDSKFDDVMEKTEEIIKYIDTKVSEKIKDTNKTIEMIINHNN